MCEVRKLVYSKTMQPLTAKAAHSLLKLFKAFVYFLFHNIYSKKKSTLGLNALKPSRDWCKRTRLNFGHHSPSLHRCTYSTLTLIYIHTHTRDKHPTSRRIQSTQAYTYKYRGRQLLWCTHTELRLFFHLAHVEWPTYKWNLVQKIRITAGSFKPIYIW